MPGWGGGGHWLFELGYQLRNYSPPPPLMHKGQPLFCHLQIYSPLFSRMPNDSLQINIECWIFLYFMHHVLPHYCFKRFLRTNLNVYNYYLVWNNSWKESCPILQYYFLSHRWSRSHRSTVVGPPSVPFSRLSTPPPPPGGCEGCFFRVGRRVGFIPLFPTPDTGLSGTSTARPPCGF